MAQWTLPWTLPGKTMILAYGLPAAGVVWRVLDRTERAKIVGEPVQRLFVIVAAVSLVLAKHELFITPHQPIHFTRGYIWSSLFLLACPMLLRVLRWLGTLRPSRQFAGVLALSAVLLSDNILWFGWQLTATPPRSTTEWRPRYRCSLSTAERAVIAYLNGCQYRRGDLVVSDRWWLSYLVPTYTAFSTPYGHQFCTPYAATRKGEVERFLETGQEPEAWQDRTLYACLTTNAQGRAVGRTGPRYAVAYSNSEYLVLKRDPISGRNEP
jgi:hypothetical protein